MNEKENLNCSGIYALVCPDSGEIRYVGRSNNINRRFADHLYSKKASSTPVSEWIYYLDKKNKKPECVILEKHENPIEIEKIWIDRARKESSDTLLNVLKGGENEFKWCVNYNHKIWVAEGLPTPFKKWISIVWIGAKNNKKISNHIAEVRDLRRSLKSEKDILSFEMHVAQYLYNKFPKHQEYVAEWAEKVAPKVNKKYPGKFSIEYKDGTVVTP